SVTWSTAFRIPDRRRDLPSDHACTRPIRASEVRSSGVGLEDFGRGRAATRVAQATKDGTLEVAQQVLGVNVGVLGEVDIVDDDDAGRGEVLHCDGYALVAKRPV